MQAPPTPVSEADPIERFLALLARSLRDDSFVKLMLGRYRGAQADLASVTVRRLTLRDEDCLSFVHRYTTRDVTTNLPLAQGLAALGEALREGFDTWASGPSCLTVVSIESSSKTARPPSRGWATEAEACTHSNPRDSSGRERKKGDA